MADEELRSLERKLAADPDDMGVATAHTNARIRTGALVTKKLHVVVSISYEYNDEFFYGNTDGGVPVLAFINEESALREAQERNVAELMSLNDIDEWLHTHDGQLFGHDVDPQELLAPMGIPYDPNANNDEALYNAIREAYNQNRITFEQALSIYQQCNLHFYEVREVNVADGYCA